jgi:hypothetical protein
VSTRGTAELAFLVELMEKLSTDAPLSRDDRHYLAELLSSIASGTDVRNRYYEHMSVDSSVRNFFVALDMHTSPNFATAPKKARANVARNWNLGEETVRAIERGMREECERFLEQYQRERDRAGITKMVDFQRSRWLKLQASNPPTKR